MEIIRIWFWMARLRFWQWRLGYGGGGNFVGCWEFYYASGFSPREAVAEDLSYL